MKECSDWGSEEWKEVARVCMTIHYNHDSLVHRLTGPIKKEAKVLELAEYFVQIYGVRPAETIAWHLTIIEWSQKLLEKEIAQMRNQNWIRNVLHR